MADVFSTARSGRCNANQELADSAIPLEIVIPVLPCRGGADIAHRLFEPLGWTVGAEPIPLDDGFPEWGDSRYLRLELTGVVRLADALNQLHVLLPCSMSPSTTGRDPTRSTSSSARARAGSRPIPTPTSSPAATSVAAAASPASHWPGSPSSATRSRSAVEPAEEEEVLQPAEERIPLNTQRHEAVQPGAAGPWGAVPSSTLAADAVSSSTGW